GAVRGIRWTAVLARHRPCTDSRLPVEPVRARTQQNISCARAGGVAVTLPVAGAGRCGRSESGGTCGDAQAPQEVAARADDRRSEHRTRLEDAGMLGVQPARSGDSRAALWLRDPQLG